MTQVVAWRRDFIGTAVIGAAVAGPLAMTSGSTPDEFGAWSAAVGEPVRITGPDGERHGKIVAVRRLEAKGARPVHVRRDSFMLQFELDHSADLAGDQLYAVARAGRVGTAMFLQRGGSVSPVRLSTIFN